MSELRRRPAPVHISPPTSPLGRTPSLHDAPAEPRLPTLTMPSTPTVRKEQLAELWSPELEQEGCSDRWRLAGHLITLGVFCGIFECVYSRGIFSANNGRLVSFCDSLDSCYRFRLLRPWLIQKGLHSPTSFKSQQSPPGSPPSRFTSPRPSHYFLLAACGKSMYRRALEIVVTASLLKYGGSTLVSIIINQTPVILKGPRHVVSFCFCFALMHVVPGDSVFCYLDSSMLAQVCLSLAEALYKLRKLNYVATVWRYSCTELGVLEVMLEILTLVLVLEANGNLRKVEEYRSAGKLQRMFRYFNRPLECLQWFGSRFWPAIGGGMAILVSQRLSETSELPHHKHWVGSAVWINVFQLVAAALILYRYMKPFKLGQKLQILFDRAISFDKDIDPCTPPPRKLRLTFDKET